MVDGDEVDRGEGKGTEATLALLGAPTGVRRAEAKGVGFYRAEAEVGLWRSGGYDGVLRGLRGERGD